MVIEAQLVVGVRWDEQAHVFVSHAPALDIYSQGVTHEDAIRAIESAMRMYLITAVEQNKIDGVLKRFSEATSGIGQASPALDQYIKVVPDDGRHGLGPIRAKDARSRMRVNVSWQRWRPYLDGR